MRFGAGPRAACITFSEGGLCAYAARSVAPSLSDQGGFCSQSNTGITLRPCRRPMTFSNYATRDYLAA